MRTKISVIFIILLIISNLFLFKKGLWLYQDQSSWVKNSLETFLLLNTQLHPFSNANYYLGFDQGIFSFNNPVLYSLIYISYNIFGSSGSQIFVSLLSYILSYVSFFMFSSIYFKDKRLRYILSLIYTFNPLMYSFRGIGVIHSVVPLFVYSFHKFYFEKNSYGKYLLLNIFASYLCVGAVRFIQSNIFLIIPYIIFGIFAFNKSTINFKKTILFICSYILIFLPLSYSFFIQFFQKTPGIFNFGVVYNNFVAKGKFYDMFNPFQSTNIILYDNRLFLIIGIALFIFFLFLLIKLIINNRSIFLILNVILMLLGMTFFEMGHIAGRDLYPFFIKLFPFLTNAPFYGLYVVNIPFILLLGMIAKKNIKALYIFSAIFIIFGALPFLDLSQFKFQKFSIDNIPFSYREYFIEPFYGIPEATHYIPFSCWRAEYMRKANTPTQCTNFGIHYSPIEYDNSRVISGAELYITKKLFENTNIDNLRITHNLKNIIYADDIVEEVDAGPQYGAGDIEYIKSLKIKIDDNKLLDILPNRYFSHYYYKNKNDFDFLIYSPKEVMIKNNIDSIFDNTLSVKNRPVVLSKNYNNLKKENIQQNVKVTYKISQFDNTKYYIKLENINKDKPFMIQLNQSFKPGWRLVWITKEEFEKRQCIDKSQLFSITNNSRCQYKNKLLDTDNIFFIGKYHIPEENHYVGNYINNTWLIRSQDLPRNTGNAKEYYAVILYSNQIYFTITLLIAGIALFFLIIYALIEDLIRIVFDK